MVSINEGQQTIVFGGCRADGTRAQDAFMLDFSDDLTRVGSGGEEVGGIDDVMEGNGTSEVKSESAPYECIVYIS